jgi:subtilisin family serine protease
MLALATAFAANPASQSGRDLADYYYYAGRRIMLDRSMTEAVVTLDSDTPSPRLSQAVSGSTLGPVRSTGHASYRIVTVPNDRTTGTAQWQTAFDSLRAVPGVQQVRPVFRDRVSGVRLFATDEVIVKVPADMSFDDVATMARTFNVTIDRSVRNAPNQFILRISAGDDAVRLARLLYETGRVVWAEPDLVQEYRRQSIPDDPGFASQWYLQNTGAGTSKTGADVSAVSAWDIEQGDPSITIAVLDSGIDLQHEDLVDNLFVNRAEIPDNNLDDDRNGYIDDVQGWDFYQYRNTPGNLYPDDDHGTAVAGIAAARGDNGIGVSGMCPRCRILPVKVSLGEAFASSDYIAEAIRYASTLADVINMSFGGGAPSNAIADALHDAATSGRGGLGTVIVASAGNSAGGNIELFAQGLPAGTHRFRWTYTKDSVDSAGEDSAWLGAVMFPGAQHVTFGDLNLPSGWTTGGDAPWTLSTDALHADEGSCSLIAARAGTITHRQSSFLETIRTVPGGDFFSLQYVSSEEDRDGLRVQIDLNNNGTFDLDSGLISGVPPPGVEFPAAYPDVIAVGASSNEDCRSHYSQVGASLAFLAPGSAGFRNLGIYTTDRTGASGYGPTNYVTDFGGTSAAAPIAAGAVGLLLSRNPGLTATGVRQMLQDSTDKIGPEPYINGRNDRYGSGRLNAYRALMLTPAAGGPPVIVTQPQGQSIPGGESVRVSVRALGLSLTYQWYEGTRGDTSRPVPGAIDAVLDTPPVIVATRVWVRVSNGFGAADSLEAVLIPGASYDSSLHVPYCSTVGAVCDSTTLLSGRRNSESHTPNTLMGACTDGTSGPAVDRIVVSSVDAGTFQTGHAVRVTVTTNLKFWPAHRLDVFVTADVFNPDWVRIGTQTVDADHQTFTVTYPLAQGGVQAVRAILREGGNDVGSCYKPIGLSSYDADHDDLAFAVQSAPQAPIILQQPASVTTSSGTEVVLTAGAIGTVPLQYQWFQGESGDISTPLAGQTARTARVIAQSTSLKYWVRASNSLGVGDSIAATVLGTVSVTAQYDPVLKVPRCTLASSCSDGSRLLAGRKFEQHGPNTIYATCADGTAGTGSENSIDTMSVSTTDGTVLAPGKTVKVQVIGSFSSPFYDFIDLYSAADATNPVWTYIATFRTNEFFVETTYTLPYGPLQALRAHLRFHGSPAPCGPGGPNSYDDYDDLAFATDSPSSLAPVILTQPQSQILPQGESANLAVSAYGAGLTYQWFFGDHGDVSSPVANAISPSLTTTVPSGTSKYWVRITGTAGVVDSDTAVLRSVVTATALYNATVRVPACLVWTAWCDSGALLSGRGAVGPESNQPNTLGSTCADGSQGTFHADESIDRIRVYSTSGDPFEPGITVKVEIALWAFSYVSDVVDVYSATNLTSPNWTYVASVTPSAGGLQTLSTTYVLPAGPVQAVRARLRYRGVQAPCGSGPYDDQDDLVFAVGGPALLGPAPKLPHTTSKFAAPALWSGAVTAFDNSPGVASRRATEAEFVTTVAREVERDGPPQSDSRSLIEVPSAASAAPPSSANAPAAATEPPLTVVFGPPRTLTLMIASDDRSVTFAEVWFRNPGPVPLHDDHTCKAYVERATNTLLLVNDAGTDLLAKKIGTDDELANGQCAIDASSLRLSADSRGLTLTMSVRFSRNYDSNVATFTESIDANGVSSGWVEQRTPQLPVVNPSVTAEKSLPASLERPVIASTRARPQE